MDLLANIDVEDLDRATTFYATALGLRRGRRLAGGVQELLGASSAIYLLQKDAGSAPWKHSPAGEARRYARHWTPVHLDFVVGDAAAAVDRAVAAGARLEQPIETHAFGRIAVLVDPFGNGFCLVEFLGRGYDELCS